VETREVTAGALITVGEIRLLPIVETSVTCRSVRNNIACYGWKHLTGIVAVSPHWKIAMDAAGREMPIEHYAVEVPEVRELLQSMG
jgi:hypothetical protein